MSVTEKFQLLGHGNGWPSRGFIINSATRLVIGTDAILPAAITSNNLNMGDVISVRPYVQPSSSNGYQATGFLRFRTLGGYSDSDSGEPTKEQLNLSLKNAMKFFYNAERGGSASASSNLSGISGSNVSSSVSPSVLVNQTSSNTGSSFTGEVLSPRERVVSFIKEIDKNGSRRHDVRSNKLFGDQNSESFFIPQTSLSNSATSGRYRVTIVRLFDTTDTDKPMFLGYGLQSNTVASGGGSREAISGTASSSIGSYFNPNSAFFNTDDEGGNVVVFNISNTDVNGMPLLVFNQASTFDGDDGNSTSSSATSGGATFSLYGGDVSGSSSISASYDFYTY
tara:strand:+ start:21 stop:1034 length:1014 start_codon:yes stop_codon:yes gene_type:complete